MIINSQIQIGPKLLSFEQDLLKHEPMFFRASWNFAYEKGNMATRHFLVSLPYELQNENTLIDSRVHMLMPGWFPCIPGYHHDDVPRERADGQPEYSNPSYRTNHALALYNGDICPTEFAIGEQEFSNPESHEVVYREWHKEVVNFITQKKLVVIKAPADHIIYFNDRTWHQGTKCVNRGFRLFIRASWGSNRKPTNEIRTNANVYMETPMEGW